MTRRRWRAPGRAAHPDRRRTIPAWPLGAALVAALLVAACGGTTGSSGAPTPFDGVLPTAASEAPTSTDAGSSTPTDAGSPTDEPAATEAPTEEPAATASPEETEEPEPTDEPTESGDGTPGGAACAGSDDNRAFFARVAESVAWPVYCPVLGDGWFVDAGQYRLANGGWMEIAYRGPSGARIELREGHYCDGDCSPSGTDLGDAAFGDLSGTLRDLGDDGYAVVVEPGAAPSWELVASGLSEDAVLTTAADLARVES